MRTISGFLQLIGVAVIAVAGYWVWFVNWGPNPNDRIGANVAAFLPAPLKDWGCGKLAQRFAAEAPTICSPVASSTSPTAPTAPTTPNSAPADPNNPGGGRL